MNDSEFKRFSAKYIVAYDGCWNWTASTNQKGYGRLKTTEGLISAHRLSYAHYIGPIDEGMHVLHACDNPRCVNPKHLWLGTNMDNVADCMAKGRVTGYLHSPVFFKKGASNHIAKLTDKKVLDIRKRIANGEEQQALAKEYGVSKACVTKIHFRRTWTHI